MRIVALSDQHGFLPDVPPCDLLIVAGDVCPDRFGLLMAVHDPHQQQAWFDRTLRPWLAATPATHKLLTWGNHDWCGQMCSFRSDTPPHARSTDLQILVDEGTTVPSDGNASREMSVWATPWSNPFMRWAFMKRPGELERVYAAIPDGIGVLVSHQPPYGYGDSTLDLDSRRVEHVGSRELLVAIERVRPRVVICGHVHGGFGRYEHQGIPIYNVSVVDESYRLVNAPTVIDLPGSEECGSSGRSWPSRRSSAGTTRKAPTVASVRTPDHHGVKTLGVCVRIFSNFSRQPLRRFYSPAAVSKMSPKLR